MKNTFLIAAALLAQVAQTAVAKTPVKQAPTPSKYFIVQNIATEKMLFTRSVRKRQAARIA